MDECECGFERFEIKSGQNIVRILKKKFIRIKELKVKVHRAESCEYDECKEEYIPSYSMYIFLDEKTNTELYREDSSLDVTIHNYSKYPMGYIYNELRCDIYMIC